MPRKGASSENIWEGLKSIPNTQSWPSGSLHQSQKRKHNQLWGEVRGRNLISRVIAFISNSQFSTTKNKTRQKKTKIKPTEIVPDKNTWWQIYKHLPVILKKLKELKEGRENQEKDAWPKQKYQQRHRKPGPPPIILKNGAEKYNNWNEIFTDRTGKQILGDGKENQQKGKKGQYELPNPRNRK